MDTAAELYHYSFEKYISPKKLSALVFVSSESIMSATLPTVGGSSLNNLL